MNKHVPYGKAQTITKSVSTRVQFPTFFFQKNQYFHSVSHSYVPKGNRRCVVEEKTKTTTTKKTPNSWEDG